MKFLHSSLCLFIFFTIHATAGIKYATIGVDGLTCSACSFSTQKSILSLNFVDSVVMDLEKNIAKVTFKKDKSISLEALAQKVFDAGFSVRNMDVTFEIKSMNVNNDNCYQIEDSYFHFIGIDGAKNLNGEITLHFIGKKFCRKKEYAKWEEKIKKSKPCSTGDKKSVVYIVTTL